MNRLMNKWMTEWINEWLCLSFVYFRVMLIFYYFIQLTFSVNIDWLNYFEQNFFDAYKRILQPSSSILTKICIFSYKQKCNVTSQKTFPCPWLPMNSSTTTTTTTNVVQIYKFLYNLLKIKKKAVMFGNLSLRRATEKAFIFQGYFHLHATLSNARPIINHYSHTIEREQVNPRNFYLHYIF